MRHEPAALGTVQRGGASCSGTGLKADAVAELAPDFQRIHKSLNGYCMPEAAARDREPGDGGKGTCGPQPLAHPKQRYRLADGPQEHAFRRRVPLGVGVRRVTAGWGRERPWPRERSRGVSQTWPYSVVYASLQSACRRRARVPHDGDDDV